MELTDDEMNKVAGGVWRTYEECGGISEEDYQRYIVDRSVNGETDPVKIHMAPMGMSNSAVETSPALKHFMDIQRSFGR